MITNNRRLRRLSLVSTGALAFRTRFVLSQSQNGRNKLRVAPNVLYDLIYNSIVSLCLYLSIFSKAELEESFRGHLDSTRDVSVELCVRLWAFHLMHSSIS
jgi:hypothetical protein